MVDHPAFWWSGHVTWYHTHPPARIIKAHRFQMIQIISIYSFHSDKPFYLLEFLAYCDQYTPKLDLQSPSRFPTTDSRNTLHLDKTRKIYRMLRFFKILTEERSGFGMLSPSILTVKFEHSKPWSEKQAHMNWKFIFKVSRQWSILRSKVKVGKNNVESICIYIYI